jgi:hypothetical protein
VRRRHAAKYDRRPRLGRFTEMRSETLAKLGVPELVGCCFPSEGDNGL